MYVRNAATFTEGRFFLFSSSLKTHGIVPSRNTSYKVSDVRRALDAVFGSGTSTPRCVCAPVSHCRLDVI